MSDFQCKKRISLVQFAKSTASPSKDDLSSYITDCPYFYSTQLKALRYDMPAYIHSNPPAALSLRPCDRACLGLAKF